MKLRLADDLVLFAGFFDLRVSSTFLVVFLADFLGAFAALAIVFAAFWTGLAPKDTAGITKCKLAPRMPALLKKIADTKTPCDRETGSGPTNA
jgi:hypothetical protein